MGVVRGGERREDADGDNNGDSTSVAPPADEGLPVTAKCTRYLEMGNVKEKTAAGTLEIGAEAIAAMIEDGFKLVINGQVQDKEVKFPLGPGTKIVAEFSYDFIVAPPKTNADARSSSARSATVQKAAPGSQLAKSTLRARLTGGADSSGKGQAFTVNLTARV